MLVHILEFGGELVCTLQRFKSDLKRLAVVFTVCLALTGHLLGFALSKKINLIGNFSRIMSW